MTNTFNLHYDEEADFLEISTGKPTKCYADEVQPGVFLRKDEKTHEVKSIGILHFKKRTKGKKDFSLPFKLHLSS